MKMFSLVLLAILSATVSLGYSTDNNNFEDLNKIASETRDYRAYYNLGVLYARTNDVGNAVLNLKRANQLNPDDKETRDTLNQLRNSIGIPAYLFENSPLEKAFLFPFTIFSINLAALIGILSLFLGGVTVSYYLSRLKIEFPWKLDEILTAQAGKIKIVSVVLMVFGILYIVSAVARYASIFDSRNAVVMVKSELKDRPSADALKIADLPDGMECTIKRSESGYYLLNTVDGRTGWVAGTNVVRNWEGK